MQGVDLARAEELLSLCLSSGLLSNLDHARSSLEPPAFVFRHALVRDVVLVPLPGPPQSVAPARLPRLAFTARC